VPDLSETIEQQIEEEVERRVQERMRAIQDRLREATAEALAEPTPKRSRARADGVTRSEAGRLFGVKTSKLRSLETRGLIRTWRSGPGGGRVMVDPNEVAEALGVPVPK
jgi:NADPH-dependent glutamate synthase beta subunit-like oxidoreductase